MKKKNKIVTIGNLANNANYLTEILNYDFEILNVINNDLPTVFENKILFNKKDSIFIKIIKFFNVYWQIIKSDLIISYTATLSNPLLFFFVIFKFKKYVAYATGSDLREHIYNNKAGKRISIFFKKADLVIVHNNDIYTINAIKKLKLKNIYWHNMYKQTEYNVNYIDSNFCFNTELRVILNEIYSYFIIYMPCWIVFSEQKNRNNYFHSKGNDVAFEALIRFVNKYPNVRIILRGKGDDYLKSKNILSSISNKVYYVNTLDKKNLINLMNLSDIILDQFFLGSFGGTAIEAASIGKPLLSFFPNIDLYKDDPYPFLQSTNSEELFINLEKLYLNDKFRNQYASDCKKWVFRNHSSNEMRKLGFLFNDIINNKKLTLPKNNGNFYDIIY